MTLRWNETASDCEVAKILAPWMSGLYWHDGRNWYWNRGDKWIKGAGQARDLFGASRVVPADSDYWKRTRSRLITGHGTYAIRRVMERACAAGMVTGGPTPHRDIEYNPVTRPCLCYGPLCQYRTNPAS